MARLDTSGLSSEVRLFHNELITVYLSHLKLDQITFWKENNRTLLSFELLERQLKKQLVDISTEEIVRFVAQRPNHQLDKLADSIAMNGVRVPLIVLDDKRLLDGNRRFFACYLLRLRAVERKKPEPPALSAIPVWIIKKSSLSRRQELKILAEANFVKDLKVPWPLDAKARAVMDYYKEVSERSGHESAVEEIRDVFSISGQTAIAYMETVELTESFIGSAKSDDERYRFREIVENHFVYFWEFRNKAMKGSGALEGRELEEAREMFFQLIRRPDLIKNLKQIEPMVMARKDEVAWSLLRNSKGTKLATVVAMINEKRSHLRDEDKVKVFLSWLKQTEDLSDKAQRALQQVVEEARRILAD